jgi:hypothetical protein
MRVAAAAISAIAQLRRNKMGVFEEEPVRLKPIVLYPPKIDHVMLALERAPFVFLAGPIQGAPDWQAEAIERLSDVSINPVIANPRSPTWHGNYYGQVDWETAHLARAAKKGVILFWLANPDPEAHQPPGRAYAQTSRFELGEWLARASHMPMHPVNLVVGIEPGFTNERYIRHRIDGLFPRRVIHTRLWSACEEVVHVVKGGK